MELRHLRYFATLTETLSFTRAAERLHITQSTLSHQIRQLEDELGVQLFRRVRRRVVVTDSGELFLSYVTHALSAVDQGASALKADASQLTGSVRVGATHTFNLDLMPECVAAFLAQHPGIRIIVEELSAEAVDTGLESGTLDLGIAYRPLSGAAVRFEPLYNEEMVLVVAANHRFARRRRVRMVELHQQSLVLLPSTFATRQLLDECFAAAHAVPHVVAEMNAVAPMLGLVARTSLGAIVARKAAEAYGALQVVPLEAPTPIRTPGILSRRQGTPPQAVLAFASLVRSIATREQTGHKRRT